MSRPMTPMHAPPTDDAPSISVELVLAVDEAFRSWEDASGQERHDTVIALNDMGATLEQIKDLAQTYSISAADIDDALLCTET